MTVLCFQAAEGLVEALGEAKELYIGILDTECQALHEIRHAAQAQLDALQVPLTAAELAPITGACSDLKEAESAYRADDPARARSSIEAASATIGAELSTLPEDNPKRPILKDMAKKLDDSRGNQDWLCRAKRILIAAGCVAACAACVVAVVVVATC